MARLLFLKINNLVRGSGAYLPRSDAKVSTAGLPLYYSPALVLNTLGAGNNLPAGRQTKRLQVRILP